VFLAPDDNSFITGVEPSLEILAGPRHEDKMHAELDDPSIHP